MTVLLFGFEPFLEYKENPSQLIVEALNGSTMLKEEVKGVILPVEYEKIEDVIVTKIREMKPILTLGIGLAPGRTKITPEKIAINYRYSREADNSGKRYRGEKIDPLGQDGIFTNIPVEDLVDYLNNNGIPAELSLTAGSYLCNNAMYIIIRESKKYNSLGGFIHVPLHESYAARIQRPIPSMSLDTMIRGIRLSIEFILTNKKENLTLS
ncbi:MAG: pyroglutamyl-peptidase I [Saccharolobus sp.]|uniref:pyroglutamyl-peptidase I n=1 Tax=Sulfolobaceae TaxID=118883 RepID=UPI001F055115|nr:MULTISPECIES: pyroglutamyl-peptidase I [Sulfolobaceae]MCH1772283.1 pyroglutamyl-peptidase I [Metallosphaera sedula]MCH4816814.1 pyroglutamyl-peptidase I [Saccharolobus shibatae]